MSASDVPVSRWRRTVLLGLSGAAAAAVAVLVWQVVGEEPSRPLQVSVLGEKSVVAQAATGNSGCGQGNGGPNGSKVCSNPGHPISVSEQHLGKLSPGQTINLAVTVVNPNNQDVQLTKIQVVKGTPTNPACSAAWFQVQDFSGSQTIKKNSQLAVSLPMSMADVAANQDACKGVAIPLTFTATVTGA
ncbi:MAG TPA: hypothetical protein VFJ14_14695 [Nocardioidaceae bacterium]|nr:hypothetical protein [Nocardioidaceae bacterium]